jgi:hypothetical protein
MFLDLVSGGLCTMAAPQVDHPMELVGGFLSEFELYDPPLDPFIGMLTDGFHKTLTDHGKSISVNLLKSRHDYLRVETRCRKLQSDQVGEQSPWGTGRPA